MNNRINIASATGVDLQLNIAGAGARSYAFVIDWHIRVLLALAWLIVMHFFIVGSFSLLNGESSHFLEYKLLVIVPAAAIYFLYHPVLEIIMRGRTPGKRIAGVRVVTLAAETPGILAHLIRNLLRLLDSLPAGYVIGLAAVMLTEKSVRIGDMAAGTVLIYDSDARGEKLNTVPVNPEAIKRYGLAKAELGQDLLDRWDSLEESRRIELAHRLLASLAPNLHLTSDSKLLRDQLAQAMKSGAVR